MGRALTSEGSFPEGGAIELLRELEQQRITGVLGFQSGEESGEIVFYGGEIAVEQPAREDGRDPVDIFLSLEDGTFELHQRLPPLAVSKGDDATRTGSLAVHVPADLLNYCENAGLTGTLELVHEGRRAEAIYEAGELLAIELDGRGDADLSKIFAWDQGRFKIALDEEAPERFRNAAPSTADDALPGWGEGAPKKRGEDTKQFLRVVEMALVDVIDKSERARSPTRTSLPLPPAPKARPRPRSLPPPPPRKAQREQTIRLVYLSGDAPEAIGDSSTRHVGKGESAEQVALPDAAPARRPSSPEAGPTVPKDGEKEAERAPNVFSALLWAIVVLAVGLLILAVLARLPPVQ